MTDIKETDLLEDLLPYCEYDKTVDVDAEYLVGSVWNDSKINISGTPMEDRDVLVFLLNLFPSKEEAVSYFVHKELFSTIRSAMGMCSDSIEGVQSFVRSVAAHLTRSNCKLTEREKDQFGNYIRLGEDFLYVKDAFEDGVIEERFKEIVPHKCPLCEHDLAINRSLTQLTCVNMRCPSIIGASVLKICQRLDVYGIGKEKAMDIVRQHRYTSLLSIFKNPPWEIEEDLSKLNTLGMTYGQAVQLLNLPELNTRVISIFDGISTYEQYREKIVEAGSLELFLLSRVGGEGKLASQAAEILTIFDYELQHVHEYINISKPAQAKFYIAMTGRNNLNFEYKGEFYPKVSKETLVTLLNDKFNGVIEFVLTQSIGKSSVLLGDDLESGSRKMNEGLEIQNELNKEALNVLAIFKQGTPHDHAEIIDANKKLALYSKMKLRSLCKEHKVPFEPDVYKTTFEECYEYCKKVLPEGTRIHSQVFWKPFIFTFTDFWYLTEDRELFLSIFYPKHPEYISSLS